MPNLLRKAPELISNRIAELGDWRGETLGRMRKLIEEAVAQGASLDDPTGLFNSSLDGKVRRAIDICEGASVDATAFKALIREAVALNGSGKSKAPKQRNP